MLTHKRPSYAFVLVPFTLAVLSAGCDPTAPSSEADESALLQLTRNGDYRLSVFAHDAYRLPVLTHGGYRLPLVLGSFDQADLDPLVHRLDLDQMRFGASNGLASFVPSGGLSMELYNDPDPTRHRVDFSIPPVDYQPPGLPFTVRVDASFLELDSNSVRLSFSDDHLQADLVARGKLHIDSPGTWPDPDLVLDRISLHSTLSYRTDSRRLFVDSVALDISAHAENCGFAFLCNALAANVVVQALGSHLADLIKDEMNRNLEDPTTSSVIVRMLDRAWNERHKRGTSVWEVQEDSLRIATSKFLFHVKLVSVPKTPTGCRRDPAQPLCGAQQSIVCDPIPAALLLQRQTSLREFSTVATDNDPARSAGPVLTDPSPPRQGTYRVCALNKAGHACSDPFLVSNCLPLPIPRIPMGKL